MSGKKEKIKGKGKREEERRRRRSARRKRTKGVAESRVGLLLQSCVVFYDAVDLDESSVVLASLLRLDLQQLINPMAYRPPC